jgi:hypothetical protein
MLILGALNMPNYFHYVDSVFLSALFVPSLCFFPDLALRMILIFRWMVVEEIYTKCLILKSYKSV